MFLLGFFLEVLFFLAIGVVVFSVFAALPDQRKYALSAALWCACWGPGVVAFEMLAGLSVAAAALAAKGWGMERMQLPTMPVADVLIGLCLIGTLMAATTAAWLHQMMIGRMTFSLFRLYVTGVMTGMGSVAGLAWSVWLATMERIPMRSPLALTGILVLSASFGYVGFRWSRGLRGDRPLNFQWISVEEFER